jgi:tripartite-type tricarboxylate transporter receptor subunit TctC
LTRQHREKTTEKWGTDEEDMAEWQRVELSQEWVREIRDLPLKTMDIAGKTGLIPDQKERRKKVMCKKKGLFLLSLLSVMVVLFLDVWVEQAQSQVKYPTRAIDLICGYAAGGGTDTNTRVVADWLRRKWGVPLNVINKPGGGSIPANLEVYSAKPDGYTLMADCQSSAGMLEVSGVKLPFKVMDRTFVAFCAFTQTIFAVSAQSAVKNLKDLEAEIKSDPGNFTWNSQGRGSSSELDFRGFMKEIGGDASKTKPVTSRGGGEAISLLSGGHIKLGSGTVISFLPAIQAGTVRAIAVRGRERHPFLPNVPTAAEQGYPYFNDLPLWWAGITGPPNLPSHVVEAWETGFQEIFKDPEFISKMRSIGSTPIYVNSSDARKYVENEIKVAKELWGVE